MSYAPWKANLPGQASGLVLLCPHLLGWGTPSPPLWVSSPKPGVGIVALGDLVQICPTISRLCKSFACEAHNRSQGRWPGCAGCLAMAKPALQSAMAFQV